MRRILFSGTTAIGVEVDSAGEHFRIEGQDIVLSAGAVASPHLAHALWGGTAGAAACPGLPLVLHLPGVGQNMRDHPNVQVRLRLKPEVPEDDIARRAVRLRYTAAGSSTPNDMILSPASIRSMPLQARIRVIRSTVVYIWPSVLANCGSPCADPTVPPAMEYRYLDDPWDPQRCAKLCACVCGSWMIRRFRLFWRSGSTHRCRTGLRCGLDHWLRHNVTSSKHHSGDL